MTKLSEQFSQGSYEQYFWIESPTLSLDHLLREIPDLILDRFLVVTSFDSGTLKLSPAERFQGWTMHGELACSPSLSSTEVPRAGYDEWYVFSSPTKFEDFYVFVNYSGFSLNASFPGDGEPTLENRMRSELSARFWEQMLRLGPETFLADGDNLILVTQREELLSGFVKAMELTSVIDTPID